MDHPLYGSVLVAVQEDISERKKQEAAILSSEKRYRDVVELANDGIFETGTSGKYVDVNPAGCEMLGYTREEIIGRSASELVADSDRERLLRDLQSLQNTAESQLMTNFGVKRKDGSILPAEVSVKILPDGRRISFLRDMTYRKESEAALSASERKYRSLVEGAYDSILVANADGNIVLFNEQLGKKFGYSERDLIGKPLEILLPERFRERHAMSRKEYVTDPRSRPMGAELELYALKKDGTEFPVDISLSPTRGEDGLRITAIIRDITERKRHEDQQTFLSQISKVLNEGLNYDDRAQVVADGLIEKLADNCVVHVFEDKELVAKGISTRDPQRKLALKEAVVAGAGMHGPFGAIEVARSRKTILVEDARIMMLENENVDARLRAIGQAMGITSYAVTPLIAMDNVIGTLAVSMSTSGRRFTPADVTFLEIVANRCAVAIENARLYRQAQIARVVTDNLPAIIGYWEKDLRCRFANRFYVEWFGFTAEQMIGMTMKQALGDELYAKNHPFIKGALEGKTQHFECDLTFLPTGEVRHTQVLYLPEIIDDEVHGFFVLVNDITDLKRAQVTAEAAVHLREEVLSIVTHDLRNPLASIDMAAQILAQMTSSEKVVRQHAERIQSAAKTMQALIADLLDFGKIQAEAFTVEREPTDVATTVDEALDAMNARACARDVQLRIEVSPNLPAILADRRRIVQVIWNLVGNAIKFTPPGGCVVVTVTNEGNAVRFSVEDTGPGIPPEDLRKVFDRFWQAKKTAGLGTGLGLAIAKGIVIAHGGDIGVDSAPGKGALFHFTIPTTTERPAVSPGQGTGPNQESKTLLANIHVLIVDDAQENLALLRFMLERAGARVTEALSITEAMQRLTDERPDVMITDIEMPDGSGYDLIERIHQSRDRAKDLPVAALTGYISEKEIKKIAEAGFDAWFSKPISPQKLLNAVKDLARRTVH